MFIKRKITTEEDRAKAIAKAREKQRKKMIKTKYGQAPLRHSKKGVYSCFYAVVVFILLVLMLIIAFASKGEVNILIGFIGLGALALSFMGLLLGVRGFRERDKNYITCKVGIGANAAFLLGLTAIFIRGLF